MHRRHAAFRTCYWFVLVIALAPLWVFAQESPGDEETADAPPVNVPVSALFTKRDEIKRFLRSLGDSDSDTYLVARDAELQLLSTELAGIRQAVESNAIGQMSFDTLVDLQTELAAELAGLADLADELESRASLRDGHIDELDEHLEEWQSLTQNAVERDAPQAVLDVAAEMRTELEQIRTRLRADRDEALEDLSAIADLQLTANTFDRELRSRRESFETVAMDAADLPMWDAEVWTTHASPRVLVETLSRFAGAISAHLREHGINLAISFLILLSMSYWLLRRTGESVEDALQHDPAGSKAAAVFNRPQAAAFLVALLGITWFGPPAPQAFNVLAWSLVPFPAAALAVTIYARPIRITVYTIALVVAMMLLRQLVDPLPLASRLFFIGQALLMLVAIFIDSRARNFRKAFPGLGSIAIRGVVALVSIVLLFVVIAEVLGLVGLAETWRAIVLGGLGFAMIFTSLTYVISGLALSLLYVRPLSKIPVVRNQRWTIIHTLRKSVRWIMAVIWVVLVLGFAGVLEPVYEWAESILNTELQLGAITVHVSQIAAGILVLVATWLVNRFVKFVLAGQSLSGTDLAEGLTYALSKILGYVIIVVGFLFAISAMGFDITKVTILAGALGVGIGFGLQNIVNNFLSGLILLFEQPIKINDITAVDNLMGKVKEMNIRSTVIETFDGAEVIVPNGDFLSKTVTNWTKSNRRRRVEIDVGVAYGTGSQQVIDILEKIAAAHEEVTGDPAPFATFTGFGDSSLNFRLYVWLAELSQILTTPSRIRQEILDELIEAGIEIPFPQRDVRVTMAGGDMPEGYPRSNERLPPEPA